MPYPKLKQESYVNLRGINQKVSHYITGEGEFLQIDGMDFSTLGSLTKAPGSTQFTIQGSTSQPTGIVEYTALSQTFQIGVPSYQILANNGVQMCNVSGRTWAAIYNYTYPVLPPFAGSPWDYSQGEVLFGCNNLDAIRFNGLTALAFGVPPPLGVVLGLTSEGILGFTLLEIYSQFQRNDGFLSPVSFQRSFSNPSNAAIAPPVVGPSSALVSFTGYSNQSFGISGVRYWVRYATSFPDTTTLYRSTGFLPLGTTVFLYSTFGSSFFSFTNTPEIPDYTLSSYAYGQSFLLSSSSRSAGYPVDAINSSLSPPSTIGAQSLNPNNMEQFNNSLFIAGFNDYPYRMWVSNLGEFEKFEEDAFIEVGSNDGDIITCLKTYFTQLVIFKFKSIWSLSGTDFQSYVLSSQTNQYGSVNANTAVIWEQRLWFLDESGIAEYNGANTKIVSDRVEYLFRRMNISVARKTAWMMYVKERNEVWCAIPIDGSTTNNMLIIYDHEADAFYTRTDKIPAYATVVTGGIATPVPYTASYSGQINYYGASMTTNNGDGFTCVIRSKYFNEMGNSVTKVFRRLFLDTDPVGASTTITTNFYVDQGSSLYYSTTMLLNDYQDRIDFGIPGKDMAVEFVYSGATPLKINGFTVELRFQRAV